MAFVGLHSGQNILNNKDKKGFNITRTQTAKQAYNAIVKKYGKVIPNAKYFHVSKGEWRKYSLKNDKKRTGKVTNDIKEWRSRPHKLDYRGIDTKGSKKKFAISQLKSPSPKRRTKKTQKMEHKPILKIITPKTNKIPGTDINIPEGYKLIKAKDWIIDDKFSGKYNKNLVKGIAMIKIIKETDKAIQVTGTRIPIKSIDDIQKAYLMTFYTQKNIWIPKSQII